MMMNCAVQSSRHPLGNLQPPDTDDRYDTQSNRRKDEPRGRGADERGQRQLSEIARGRDHRRRPESVGQRRDERSGRAKPPPEPECHERRKCTRLDDVP